MSEILGRIRVRETHGIRRFLYPLRARVHFPVAVRDLMPIEKTFEAIAFFTADGSPIPMQIDIISGTSDFYLNFALPLDPFGIKDLVLTKGMPPALVEDPLHVTATEEGGLKSVQARFHITVDAGGDITNVVYDGAAHLRGGTAIRRNGGAAWVSSSTAHSQPYPVMASEVKTKEKYEDGCLAQTYTEITACKSWATLTHLLETPKPYDEIVFTLCLAITAPTLICDFGVGGYVFGKLDKKASEIVWQTTFGDVPHARWSVTTAGRTDYVGEVETAEAFLPQRWFHLIDSAKALAVAITKVPDDCREMTVRLTHEGDVSIAFRLGDTITGPAEFAVTDHFLNDVPAIAAATNPQSILLPPVVEVLPV